MGTVTIFFLSLVIGYYFFSYSSHPIRKNKRIPKIRFKNLEILPNFRLHIGEKTYWLHHWMLLSVAMLVIIPSFDGLQHLSMVKGAAIGGILQGLKYPDRFQIRHPRLLK